MRKKDKNKINCDVEDCKYNDSEEGKCELDEIKVGYSDDTDECYDSNDTACESFETEEESDDDEITDEEYEVNSESDNEEDEKEEA
ncbi:MAG: DUF1540 domain-containing protein [Bacilli bacterium]|nr:DUF1540 domain-containing protein [Bacilli bacterium]